MQAYAYCGCYYTLPKTIGDCANEQLQSQPPPTTVSTTTEPLATISTGSEIPASSVITDEEPTPPTLTSSEEPSSTSDQNPLTSLDPQISTARFENPDPNSTWPSPNAVPSTTTIELPTSTVISTYTTTIYTATMTVTTTISSAVISTSTVYTCASGDVTLPTPARNGSTVCVGCQRGRRSRIF